MKRVIVIPAVLPTAALTELKQWLGITTTSADDGSLGSLLRTSLETCEAFTGVMPLLVSCEEIVAACADWRALTVRPVQAITAAASLSADGTRSLLPVDAYAAEIDADGGGRVRMSGMAAASRVVITYAAGLAISWDALPEGLRHGIVRLAAHQYREREGSGASPLPPASVAALWRPWRRLRLT